MQKRVEAKRLQVINLYQTQGFSVAKVAETLEMTKTTVRKVLLSENILIRTQSEQQLLMNGSGSLKHDAFDTFTEESMYWIGFIYADGYVHSKNGRYLITIDLSTRDKKHLEKFKSFLSAGVSIRDNVRKKGDNIYYTSNITISSKRLFDRLTELGFTNNKTYDAKAHESLIHESAFWRGVFDGDGWISKSHTRQYDYCWVGLCGTFDTIQTYIEFIKDKITTKVEAPRHKKGTKSNYETAFVNEVGKKVLELLYKDATVYLERKYETYLEMCQEFN